MSEETNKPDPEYLKKLEKYAEGLRLVRYYSIQRIDLLIISLSGAGIYTCFEIMKYFDKAPVLNHYINIPFKISGGLFALAIILNFLSQWTAYTGSSYALNSTLLDIKSVENAKKISDESKALEKRGEKLNDITRRTNLLSNILMILGLLILMIYSLYLF
jgi:hypothetical protein